MSLGTEVGLGPGDIALDGDPALPHEVGTAAFRCVSIVANRSTVSATAELVLHSLRQTVCILYNAFLKRD